MNEANTFFASLYINNPIGYVLGFLFAMTVHICCIFEFMDNFTVQARCAYYLVLWHIFCNTNKFKFQILKYLQSNIQSNIAIKYIGYNLIFNITYSTSNMQSNIILRVVLGRSLLRIVLIECHTKQVFYTASKWDILCSNFVVYNC